MTLTIDPDSWDAGVRDGATSKGPGRCSWSYTSGHTEGAAFRDGYEVSMQVARIAQATGATHGTRLS
jgi:hypothetical protein